MLYFAYGSCMDEGDFKRTCPSARTVCRDAVLFGYRLVFDGRSAARQGGVANIKGDRGGAVRGVLWEVPDEEMIVLDRREGAPFVYARFPVKVKADGRWVMAETYQLARSLPYEVAPSWEYARLMLDGIANPDYRNKVEQQIIELIAREELMRCV